MAHTVFMRPESAVVDTSNKNDVRYNAYIGRAFAPTKKIRIMPD